MGSEDTLIGSWKDEIGPSPADLGDEPFIDDMDDDPPADNWDDDLDEEFDDEPELEEEPESVGEHLDMVDLNRMEWERIQYDIYPGGDDPPQGGVAHVHRDTDEVQRWLCSERQTCR